mgnify:CR=1 FL=1
MHPAFEQAVDVGSFEYLAPVPIHFLKMRRLLLLKERMQVMGRLICPGN